MSSTNPYRSPAASLATDRVVDAARCPGCGEQNAAHVGFTWWGGVVRPRMFRIVRCNACGVPYDRTSGRSLRTKILVYQVVSMGLTLVAVYWILAG